MNTTETVSSIIDNVDYAVKHCRSCPPDCVEEMLCAARELDRTVSIIADGVHSESSLSGPDAALEYLRSTAGKIESFRSLGPGDPRLECLDNVLSATKELRRGLEGLPL